MNLFINPQILIGFTAMYTFQSSNEGVARATVGNLQTRFMQRAAIDVLEIIKHFGFVTPIPVSWQKFGRLFLPEQPLGSEEDDFDVADLVYKSPRQGISFFSNTMEVLKLLFVWVAEKKSLNCKIRGPFERVRGQVSKDGTTKNELVRLVKADGQLETRERFPKIQEDTFQLVFYHNYEPYNLLSVPDALYSLLTDGKSTSEDKRRSHITFDNLLSDLEIENLPGKLLYKIQQIEAEGTSTYIKERMEKEVKSKKTPSVEGTVSDEPKKKKRTSKNVKKKNEWLKGQCPLEPIADSSDDEEAVVPDVDTFKRSFKFHKGELSKLGMKKGDKIVVTPQSVVDEFDAAISVHAEKLIRLIMARSAGMRIKADESNHTLFGPKYLQPEADGNNKREDTLYCSGFSKDIIHFLSGVCDFAIDQHMKCNESESNDPYGVLNMVRSGSVLLNPVREELLTMSTHLFEDKHGANAISKSILEEEVFLQSKTTDAEQTTQALYQEMNKFCMSRLMKMEKSRTDVTQKKFDSNALDSTSNDGGKGDGRNTEQESLTVNEFDSNVLDSPSNHGGKGEGMDTEEASHTEMDTKESDVANSGYPSDPEKFNYESSPPVSQDESESKGDEVDSKHASQSESSDEETAQASQPTNKRNAARSTEMVMDSSSNEETAQASQPTRKRKAASSPPPTSDSEENADDAGDSVEYAIEDGKAKQKVAKAKLPSIMEMEMKAAQSKVLKRPEKSPVINVTTSARPASQKKTSNKKAKNPRRTKK
jgi:hypothetical protein